jgi:hypothetical protein
VPSARVESRRPQDPHGLSGRPSRDRLALRANSIKPGPHAPAFSFPAAALPPSRRMLIQASHLRHRVPPRARNSWLSHEALRPVG